MSCWLKRFASKPKPKRCRRKGHRGHEDAGRSRSGDQAAAGGLAEATVQEAKAVSLEKEGLAEAVVLEKKAVAEAKGIEAKATAIEKQGLAEANVDLEKYRSEAIGITEKAEAMKVWTASARSTKSSSCN